MEEARLYNGECELIDNLCLIGDNDSISEITINEKGTMDVKCIRSTYMGNGEFVDKEYYYQGITRISFKIRHSKWIKLF